MPEEASVATVLVADDDPARAESLRASIADPETFGVEVVHTLDETLDRLGEGGVDVVLLELGIGDGAVRAALQRAPDVPVVAIVDDEDQAGTALAAGARDFLLAPPVGPDVARRAIRHALEWSQVWAEVHRHAIGDEPTGLYNARGFEHLARHHMAIADRTKEPVILLFVRIENLGEASGSRSGEERRMVADTAGVLRAAVREADVLARIGTDAFCVLLTGNAAGAETLVLSRLVGAVTDHNARSGRPYLALAVGSARYDPEHPVPLEDLIRVAGERMAVEAPKARPP